MLSVSSRYELIRSTKCSDQKYYQHLQHPELVRLTLTLRDVLQRATFKRRILVAETVVGTGRKQESFQSFRLAEHFLQVFTRVPCIFQRSNIDIRGPHPVLIDSGRTFGGDVAPVSPSVQAEMN